MVTQFEVGLDPCHGLPDFGQCCATLEVVEGFQPLYRVAFDTGADTVPNDRVEVDKHTGPKKTINLVLASSVSSHETLQGCRLIWCIVVNVKVGILRKTRHHEVDKCFEGGFLCPTRQCPVGGVRDIAGLVAQRITKEELQTSAADERVALKIKKDIAGRGRGQDATPKTWHHW